MVEKVLSLTDLEPFTIYRVSLTNAAICYTRLGDFDRATALQGRALRIQEQHPATRGLIQALGQLGTIFLSKGDAAQAVPYLRRALAVAKDLHENGDAALWAGNLAKAHVELGRWDEATEFNDEETRLRKRVEVVDRCRISFPRRGSQRGGDATTRHASSLKMQ
jgi:tetratricopeptide (TPR) repeat protein